MTTLDRNEIYTQGMTRAFIQHGGPGTQTYLFGLGAQYGTIEGASLPQAVGSIDPIYQPDPRRAQTFRLVGTQSAAPELPSVSVNFHEKMGGIPRQLLAPRCEFNLYEVHGRCNDLSDFNRGWSGYVNIYSGFKYTGTVDLGARMSMDGDEALTDGIEATGEAIYPVGEMSFGEEAGTAIVADVLDVVYGTAINCSACGAENDGSKFIYAVTRANVASPSAPSQVVYSLNGGQTWTNATITGIGTTAEPRYIDIVNNILFVGTDATTLFYTALNTDTGAPTTWQSVTLPVAMRDAWVESPNAIWFVGASAIYKTTDITIPPALVDSTSDTLLRIHGTGEGVVVAVGHAGLVRYSRNGGISWVTGVAPAASNLRAVQVIEDRLWYVGALNGNVYKSVDFGTSWAAITFPGAGTGQINDIVAATREVIWIAQVISSVAYLITTIDGGFSWVGSNSNAPRIENWPTFQNIHRLAAPIYAPHGIAANYLSVAGTAMGGADGILLTASANII